MRNKCKGKKNREDRIARLMLKINLNQEDLQVNNKRILMNKKFSKKIKINSSSLNLRIL